MMNKSESIKELATALAKAQGEIENASKNAANPHFKSKYADLAECLNTIRPIFSKHGLSLSQFPSFIDGVASVESIIMHSSGEWISSVASSPVSKQDAQGVGSATTYLRRYSLAAIAGIAQEDDDANSAVGNQPKKPEPVKLISADQVIELNDAIKYYGADKEKFIKWLGCETLEKLPANKYDAAITALKEKEKKNVKSEA